jgi:hypothetical protein
MTRIQKVGANMQSLKKRANMQLEKKIRTIMQGNISYGNQPSCENYGNYNQDGWILIQGLGEEVVCFIT